MRGLLALAALIGCGKSRDEAPPVAARAEGLREVRAFEGEVALIAGARTFAVVDGTVWYVPGTGGLERTSTGAAIDQVCAGEIETFLGNTPIVTCGEEHHERAFRIGAKATEIELPGAVQRVVAFRNGPEVWLYLEKLAARLAIVDGTRVTPLPAIERVAPVPEDESPVRKKACEAPNLLDVAASGEVVVALVSECNPEAPVRVARYRWPGPASEIVGLVAASKLGMEPDQIAVAHDGSFVVAGIAGGKLATLRPGGALELGPGPASQVIEVVIADDGALWALTLGARGKDSEWILTRDRGVVALPAGLHAEGLAVDERLGVVVKLVGKGVHAIYAERGP